MVPLPDTLLAKMSIDAEMVRRLYEDDPFFRARAFRYAQLEQAIQEGEARSDAETIARKYLSMLRKRREDVLIELIDLVVKSTAVTQKPLWKVPPAQRSCLAAPASANRSWRWP
jgi:hypothetical protein